MCPHNICFLFLHENICCEYSLEALYWCTFIEYQNMFLWRNKKNINLQLKKKTPKKKQKQKKNKKKQPMSGAM